MKEWRSVLLTHSAIEQRPSCRWPLLLGVSVRTARACVPGLAVGLSLPFLLAAVTVPSVTLSILLFICFYFTLSLAVSGYWSIPLELNPQLVGTISGMMNAAGNL